MFSLLARYSCHNLVRLHLIRTRWCLRLLNIVLDDPRGVINP